MQRQCDSVTMGNMATLVNTIGAVRANHTGVYRSPYQIVFRLYATECQLIALEVTGDTPTYNATATAGLPGPIADVPLVDVAATRDELSKKFVITVLNRDVANEVALKIDLPGINASKAKVIELGAKDIFAANTFETPGDIKTM